MPPVRVVRVFFFARLAARGTWAGNAATEENKCHTQVGIQDLWMAFGLGKTKAPLQTSACVSPFQGLGRTLKSHELEGRHFVGTLHLDHHLRGMETPSAKPAVCPCEVSQTFESTLESDSESRLIFVCM